MKEINDLLEQYKKAVLQKDLKAYVAIYDEHIHVFDMWVIWKYNGLETWSGMAKEWFNSLGGNSDIITFEDVKIESSPEMAFVTAIVKYTAVSEKREELRYLQNRLTWIMGKKGDQWKVIHQHTSSPIDFKTLQAILKQ